MCKLPKKAGSKARKALNRKLWDRGLHGKMERKARENESNRENAPERGDKGAVELDTSNLWSWHRP